MGNFPCFDPEVFEASTKPVTYLKEAGVALITQPHTDLSGVKNFLEKFNKRYENYLLDPVVLSDADQLAKFAGQSCYFSFGEKRTWNEDASKYFENIKEQAHGSVVEHPTFSFFVWGIDRAVSLEIVRHRAGFGFSQASQRYIDDANLRFILNEEFDDNGPLFSNFVDGCAEALIRYGNVVDNLSVKYANAGMNKRDARKRINQSARRFLPNSTETFLTITANARGLRHFFEMRASQFADLPIQDLSLKMFNIVKQVAPIIFEDYVEKMQPDGVHAELTTRYRKV
jgi:thymidylate synthase (FAD)